jgi:hypothetical protein
MRDDFAEEVKRTLAARVGNRCSRPGCCALTSGPQDDPTKALNVGVAAHITAAAQGGPRYDPLLSSGERCRADNGIWLCQTCAKLVDNDTSQFPVDLLRAWKTIAEHDARTTIGKTASLAGRSDRWLSLLHARQELEAKLQPLLEIEEAGIKVVPSVKIGKDKSDYRREQIKRLKRDIEDISEQLASEERHEAESRDNTAAKQRHLVSNLILELEGILATAAHPTSGLPGLQSYIPPSTQCWHSSSNELFFLDDPDTVKELRQVYAKVERWKGIVASGINPGIGNLEIPEITIDLSVRLPGLIENLKRAV